MITNLNPDNTGNVLKFHFTDEHHLAELIVRYQDDYEVLSINGPMNINQIGDGVIYFIRKSDK